ncbi:cysteine desulfurase family protein [uncultured Sphingomonas sp.]|uniref:cysteine desulfurase family protein n=1 Tax=uncultured Sphingomonas sp. TaxID=158754 RepID=UPI0025ED9605|nr:cysteine desulfurase family protein [uncultured Sphingomonas sp.]
MIYLDYQATTPLAPEALAAMLPWLESQHANPHSPHAPARAARAAVEVARAQVGAMLPPGGSLAFTSGATEALNWAIKGTMGPIVTLATEHAAVLDTVAATGRPVIVLPVGTDGLVDLDAARAAIVPGTGLVAAMLVNNEIGVTQPIAELVEIAHQAGALFLCDAVQGYGRVPIPPTCDLVAISAHKIHGPKGIGALWVRDGVTLTPLLHGGGQEALGRSGTLSPALCAGFGAAAKVAASRAEGDAAHVSRLFGLAAERLQLSPLPPAGGDGGGCDVAVLSFTEQPATLTHPPLAPPASGRGTLGWALNGSASNRYHGNLNLRREGLDVARLMSDLRDIAFSAGSACASGSGRPSHVLRAMGLSDAQARSSIRIGFGRMTTEEELMTALDRLCAAADAQRVAA